MVWDITGFPEVAVPILMNRGLKGGLRRVGGHHHGRVAVSIPTNRELKVGSNVGSPRHHNDCSAYPAE